MQSTFDIAHRPGHRVYPIYTFFLGGMHRATLTLFHAFHAWMGHGAAKWECHGFTPGSLLLWVFDDVWSC